MLSQPPPLVRTPTDRAAQSFVDYFGKCVAGFGISVVVIACVCVAVGFLGLFVASLWATGPAADVCVPQPTTLPHLSFRAYFFVYALTLPLASLVLLMSYALGNWCTNHEELGGSPECGNGCSYLGLMLGIAALLLHTIWILLAFAAYSDTKDWTLGSEYCLAAQQVNTVLASIWTFYAIVFGGIAGSICVLLKYKS